MIGALDKELDADEFLNDLKSRLDLKAIRHTNATGKKVKKVAVCGGAGSFLIGKAKSMGADIFVTADLKYHDFFAAEDDFILVDVGHYESEKYTKELLNQLIIEKFPTFAPTLSKVDANPVKYL
jgi:putative NIF3 family GTP cyclohydrolase 1 type 2